MATSYEAKGVGSYKMKFREPHLELEPPADEIEAVGGALGHLAEQGILGGTDYDAGLFLKHREAVRDNFDIPWTAISPRMQRLLYAINAIRRPDVMVAVGIFCGNTLISNAGAAVGPGACYEAERLVGIEIVAPEAERAARNVATIDAAGQAEILAADAVEWLAANPSRIDLLYIDANGSYLPIVETAARSALPRGSLVLAHNSINQASQLAPYLRFVRDPRNSVESVNVMIDDQGLEVTLWRG